EGGVEQMEIERINENTIKFYISYIDIEDRGFEREEIWYDRERSEQLFWQMMDEVNYKEDFNVDGPLWIQVQAMDKGLEITVTKAQLSKNGEQLELLTEDDSIELPHNDEQLDKLLDDKAADQTTNKQEKKRKEDKKEDENLTLMLKFESFEDVIQLSHYFKKDLAGITTKLYAHRNKYYLFIEFSYEMNDEVQENLISQLFEFGEDSNYTTYYLEEYGKVIFEQDVFTAVQSYFSM